MDPSYKARKEAFVSNLSGSSISDINLISLVVPTSVLLWSALQSRLSFFTPYGPAALVTDFLLNVLVVLFATTAYSSAPLLLNILLATPAVLLFLTQPRIRSPQKAKPPRKQVVQNDRSQEQAEPLPIHPFLTAYRSAMMVITCIAILAVDFRVFPRRLAKVENWGTSLMDMGVGSFVFSAGVVSARALLKSRDSRSPKTVVQRLVGSIRHSVPLLVLGLIRLWSVKGLDYAEHVTEYGVHWNFFFTLGFLPPFVEIFDLMTVFIPWHEALAIGIAVLYQVALESTNLKEYILISPRGADLLSKNREGIFSFLGYLAIFLAGRGVGARIITRENRKSVLQRIGLQTLFWITLFFFNSTYAFGYGANIPVSRRLANMPYVLWVAAFNSAQLFLFCLIETVFFPAINRATSKGGRDEQTSFATSPILHAFNHGGLAIFLIANLLTGAVNLSIPTLDIGAPQAMAILVIYAAILTGIALFMVKANIKLRL
ncbi:hypothetical protein N7495_003342 [Penicillium taxi]|uniref:uncharacterized protein n=1 Tax=Penicillium taxi TaxID=168475 RepID=UPI002544D419|nr:uncharacterized protein N7495_003342 [Penicillium taxi]KAJ5902814.1 hypothetical protein N7495_003342 [Penicillium taxi]